MKEFKSAKTILSYHRPDRYDEETKIIIKAMKEYANQFIDAAAGIALSWENTDELSLIIKKELKKENI